MLPLTAARSCRFRDISSEPRSRSPRERARKRDVTRASTRNHCMSAQSTRPARPARTCANPRFLRGFSVERSAAPALHRGFFFASVRRTRDSQTRLGLREMPVERRSWTERAKRTRSVPRLAARGTKCCGEGANPRPWGFVQRELAAIVQSVRVPTPLVARAAHTPARLVSAARWVDARRSRNAVKQNIRHALRDLLRLGQPQIARQLSCSQQMATDLRQKP